MSTEAENLVKKSIELRESGRSEEAILTARSATKSDPENANTWWQLGLAVAQKDGEASAIEYFKKTVDLAYDYAYGWYKLGNAYKKAGMIDDAVESWETCICYDEENNICRYSLVDAYKSRDRETDKESLLEQLEALEERKKLRPDDYHNLAIFHHNNKEYLKAIPYYHEYLSRRSEPHGYTNLALAYSSSEISQDLDAVDCCLQALRLDSKFERAEKLYQNLKTKLINLKAEVIKDCPSKNLLVESEWYEYYVSPFELLNIEASQEEVDIKEIQKAKKILLQEIELENGIIEWMHGIKLDKSRAIKITDEIIDENKRHFHQIIYKFKPLLNFLSRGDINLFLIDDDEYSNENSELQNTLDAFYDYEEFNEWISEIYHKQYDKVFATAFKKKKYYIEEAMLDGRRFVNKEKQDKCFTTALREADNCLNNLKKLNEKSTKVKPNIDEVKAELKRDNLAQFLEILPTEFISLQMEAGSIIRSIAIKAYNEHGDPDLSKAILNLNTTIAKKSKSFKYQLEKDTKQLDELIAKEKKDETYLSFGKTEFNITREGIKYGEKYIKSSDVETLRWGVTITSGSMGEDYKLIS